MYEDLLKNVESCKIMKPRASSLSDLEETRNRYPGIPTDYLSFLREVGWGNFGSIMLYNRVSEPEDINSYYEGKLPGIVLFGDDFQGYSYGFDSDDKYHLVEIDPDANVEMLGKTFESFIRWELENLWTGGA